MNRYNIFNLNLPTVPVPTQNLPPLKPLNLSPHVFSANVIKGKKKAENRRLLVPTASNPIHYSSSKVIFKKITYDSEVGLLQKEKSSLTDRKYIAKCKSLILNNAFSYFTYKNCCNNGTSKYGNK